MALAVSGSGGLMARVDPAERDELTAGPGVTPMVMNGRETKGWVRVADAALAEDAALQAWVERCTSYVRTLSD